MADEAFYQAAQRWLASQLGADARCPRCRDDQWRISDPGYPIIQFSCGHCGHVLRTGIDSIDDTGWGGYPSPR